MFIPNIKRFPCFHRVMVTQVKFGRTRNVVETVSTVISSSQIFTSVTITLRKHGKNGFYCFCEIKARSNFLCIHRVMVNGIEPIRARVISYLFHKWFFFFGFSSSPHFICMIFWRHGKILKYKMAPVEDDIFSEYINSCGEINYWHHNWLLIWKFNWFVWRINKLQIAFSDTYPHYTSSRLLKLRPRALSSSSATINRILD